MHLVACFQNFKFNFIRLTVFIPTWHRKGMVNFRAAIKYKTLYSFVFQNMTAAAAEWQLYLLLDPTH